MNDMALWWNWYTQETYSKFEHLGSNSLSESGQIRGTLNR